MKKVVTTGCFRPFERSIKAKDTSHSDEKYVEQAIKAASSDRSALEKNWVVSRGCL